MKLVMVLYPSKHHKVAFGKLEGQPIPGSVEGELGLREWIESEGHDLATIAAREGDELEEHLGDAEVLITTPFWPVYVTQEMMESAPNLKLILTAGVGSDHVDLAEAANRGIIVAEQTASNVVSVAEHAVMCVLNLVRNFIPQYYQVINGEWDIAALASRSYDLEGKTVGIYGAGAIGQLVAMRLKPFDVNVLLQAQPSLERRRTGLRLPVHAPRRHAGALRRHRHRSSPDAGDGEPLRPRHAL